MSLHAELCCVPVSLFLCILRVSRSLLCARPATLGTGKFNGRQELTFNSNPGPPRQVNSPTSKQECCSFPVLWGRKKYACEMFTVDAGTESAPETPAGVPHNYFFLFKGQVV